MAFTNSQRNGLYATVAVLAGAVALLQGQIDPLRRQEAIEPRNVSKVALGLKGAALPFEYTLGAVSGFRQVIAGLLWVRSDSFFHSGNYDAILPLIRLITWLDPNWLDPYATGAWHLTYNFTDTDQRSDRRYLPAGVALLNEGIANNPDVYDMYKEKGWLYFDKIKDYEKSAEAYEQGMKHNPDITQVGHALAHAYERQGKLDDAIRVWNLCIAEHQKILDDPKSSSDLKGRNQQGLANSKKILRLLQLRRQFRVKDTQPPIDNQLTYVVTRTQPRVLEIKGTWNLQGAKSFDDTRGIDIVGPVEGARVDVRLQDAGYQMPDPKEFSFDVDNSLTVMQDQLSTRGGKQALKGGIYFFSQKQANAERTADKAAVYAFSPEDKGTVGLGVHLDQALAGKAPLSPLGQRQLVSIAYPVPYNSNVQVQPVAQVPVLMARLKSDPAKIADLTKKGYMVATRDVLIPGDYKREIDMSKDPKMYSFSKDKYDLILSVNPRQFPDFVKDRMGWNGEGLTDKHLDTTTVPGVRMIRIVIPVTREDIVGNGTKVIAKSEP